MERQRILRTRAAAAYLGVAASTLEKLRLTGDGPPFILLGRRAIGYALEDLDTWVNSRRRTSTSEYDSAARATAV